MPNQGWPTLQLQPCCGSLWPTLSVHSTYWTWFGGPSPSLHGPEQETTSCQHNYHRPAQKKHHLPKEFTTVTKTKVRMKIQSFCRVVVIITLNLYMRGPRFKLSQETNYFSCNSTSFSSIPSRKSSDYASRQSTIAYFHILYILLFSHLAICHYTTCAVDKYQQRYKTQP